LLDYYALRLLFIMLCLSVKPKIRKLTQYRAKAKADFLRFYFIQSFENQASDDIYQPNTFAGYIAGNSLWQ
jgi:hypothetical protein